MPALLLAALLSADPSPLDTGGEPGSDWDTTVLSDVFTAEGAAAADFDRDGDADVVIGPHLYDGPDWTPREIMPPAEFDPHGYSDKFLSFAADLTGDGYPDLIHIGFPGKETVWYENPGGGRAAADGHWRSHVAAPVVDNESPLVADLTGDGRPELVAHTGGAFGYFTPGPAAPETPWAFHPISDADPRRGRFTHGLGVGDVNGDGRTDLIEKDGWWEQPDSLAGDPLWTHHPVPFAGKAAQMFAWDIDGDGDADVLTADNAHGYGLHWFEQVRPPAGADESLGETRWVKHVIMGDDRSNPAPILFTQPHGVAAADIDGDGLTDFVTGKRYWAHGPQGDVDPAGTPVLTWWRLTRDDAADGGTGVTFEPHVIHDASGVGTQVTVADLNGDGRPDVVVGNKKGAFVSVQR